MEASVYSSNESSSFTSDKLNEHVKLMMENDSVKKQSAERLRRKAWQQREARVIVQKKLTATETFFDTGFGLCVFEMSLVSMMFLIWYNYHLYSIIITKRLIHWPNAQLLLFISLAALKNVRILYRNCFKDWYKSFFLIFNIKH